MRRYGESKQHEAAKEKVANALRDKGFTVYIDSHPFECKTEKGPRTYWPDVYAQNFCSIGVNIPMGNAKQLPRGCRRIIVEIQGFKAHKSKAAYQSDLLRIRDIRNEHGPIEAFEVFLGSKKSRNDIRNWTTQDICEELGL